jgi:D-glycero-D-manno-heptose 1,7-bisphosphate phosphatase
VEALDFSTIDKTWTLFLDRDGVINYEKRNGYISGWKDYKLYEDALEALALFAKVFGRIVIVSNQKGVGRGITKLKDLNDITERLLALVNESGGRIDKVYYAFDIDDTALNRKPNPGMAWQAKTDFPEINFGKSIMVGNRLSDMEFAHNAGMVGVFLATTHPETEFPHPWITARYGGLGEMAGEVGKVRKEE